MIFRHTILYVVGVPATLAFNEAAFDLTRALLHDSNDFAELATGETKPAFCSTRLLEQMGKTVSGRGPDAPRQPNRAFSAAPTAPKSICPV